MGVVISDTSAAQAEVFNDNITRLGEASAGAGNQIAAEMLPSLVDLSELLVDLNKNSEATGVIANVLAGAMKVLATVAIVVGTAFTATGGAIAGVAAAIGFAVWELRHPAPLLDIRLFAKRSLTSGSVTLLVWFGVQAGVFVVLFPFFQAVLGWSLGGWRASLGAVHYSKQEDVAQNEAPSDGYTLVDAHLAYRWDRNASNSYEVFLDGSNLTNREVRPHTSLLRDYSPLPGRGAGRRRPGLRSWIAQRCRRGCKLS